jgi:hypothetical protein
MQSKRVEKKKTKDQLQGSVQHICGGMRKPERASRVNAGKE